MRRFQRRLCLCLAAACVSGSFASTASAQVTEPEEGQLLSNGFVVRLAPTATIKEMQKQERLFEMEVTFKSMRMRWVNITDPKDPTKKTRERVWYLVYKAVNRKLDVPDDGGLVAKNEEDEIKPPYFIPRFTLVTTDNNEYKIYRDVVIPEAIADIRKRESRYEGQGPLINTVDAAKPVPQPVAITDKQQNAIYGVAMWRGVDPKTDYFTIYMSGFSNAFMDRKSAEQLNVEQLRRLNLELGRKAEDLASLDKDQLLALLFPKLGMDEQVYRKVIVQKFKRPGDEFFETELEFDRIPADDPKDPKSYYPRWIYVPDDAREPAAKKPAPKPPAAKQQ